MMARKKAEENDETYKVKMPDLEQILMDQNKLAALQKQLNEKIAMSTRLEKKNDIIKGQLTKLSEAVANYHEQIKKYDTELKNGKRVMELPCNHLEIINQLEVHLKSKQNEI